jgi:hypothetical protein
MGFAIADEVTILGLTISRETGSVSEIVFDHHKQDKKANCQLASL